MTTFDMPPIPAELMDDQPISAEDFEAAAAVLDTAGLAPFDELVQEQREAEEAVDAATNEDQPWRLGQLPSSFGRFQVTDDGTAEWALRKAAEQDTRLDEIAAQAQGWRDEIDRWETQQGKAPTSFRAFLVAHLTAYMAARVDADQKLRTVSLPSGKLKATSHKAKVGLSEIPDQLAELIAWADENLEGEELDAVVKTTRKPMVSELAKIAQPSTELLGNRHHVTLACEHTLDMFWGVDQADSDLIFHVGDQCRCHACPEDFGEVVMQEVVTVDIEPVEQPVVRYNDGGQAIPGAVVVPAAMTYKVQVGG